MEQKLRGADVRSCGADVTEVTRGQSAGVGQELRGTDVTEVAMGTEFWGRTGVARD